MALQVNFTGWCTSGLIKIARLYPGPKLAQGCYERLAVRICFLVIKACIFPSGARGVCAYEHESFDSLCLYITTGSWSYVKVVCSLDVDDTVTQGEHERL